MSTLFCYDARYSAQFGICHFLFQDLSKTHFESGPPLPPTKMNCELAMECLAKLHASWWDHPQLLGYEEARQKSFENYFRNIDEVTPQFFNFLADRISDKRRRLIDLVVSEFPELCQKRISEGEPLTLVHNDAHFGNFLYPHNAETGTTLLIDWQDWGISLGIRDLAIMIALFWYPAQRQAMEKKLVHHYHLKLLENGVTGFNWEDCWLSYRFAVAGVLLNPIYRYFRKSPPYLWFSHLERCLLAFDDLDCLELLQS